LNDFIIRNRNQPISAVDALILKDGLKRNADQIKGNANKKVFNIKTLDVENLEDSTLKNHALQIASLLKGKIQGQSAKRLEELVKSLEQK
jgi:hypothetical protein